MVIHAAKLSRRRRTCSPGIASLLCSLLALASSGCYVGTAAAALGIYSLSKDGDSGAVNAPPARPASETPVRVDGEHVLAVYFLLDDEGGLLDVEVTWQALDDAGGALTALAPASEFPGEVRAPDGKRVRSDGTRGLRVPPNTSVAFRFVWDARRDLLRSPLARGVARVRLRVDVREEGGEGEAGRSDRLVEGIEEAQGQGGKGGGQVG